MGRPVAPTHFLPQPGKSLLVLQTYSALPQHLVFLCAGTLPFSKHRNKLNASSNSTSHSAFFDFSSPRVSPFSELLPWWAQQLTFLESPLQAGLQTCYFTNIVLVHLQKKTCKPIVISLFHCQWGKWHVHIIYFLWKHELRRARTMSFSPPAPYYLVPNK